MPDVEAKELVGCSEERDRGSEGGVVCNGYGGVKDVGVIVFVG